MTPLQVIIFFLLSYIALAQARGTILVNNVYSSSEEEIIIDNLRGVGGLPVTGTSSINITAPNMALQGNLMSIAQEKDLLFRSSEWNVTLQGGSDLDTKSKLLHFHANQIDIQAPRGDIRFKAKDQISMEADQNISLQAGHGGLAFQSLSGSLSVAASDQLRIHGKQSVLVESQHENIYITSLFGTSFRTTSLSDSNGNDVTSPSDSNGNDVGDRHSNGNLMLFSESILNLDSFKDISIESVDGSVQIQSDSITLTTLGWNAVSTGSGESSGTNEGDGDGDGFSSEHVAHLESVSNELRLIGYEGVAVNARRQMDIQGTRGGVSFTASGESGRVGLTSTQGSLQFSSSSNSESSRIVLESSEWTLSHPGGLRIESGGDSVLYSGKSLEIFSEQGGILSSSQLNGNLNSNGDLSFGLSLSGSEPDESGPDESLRSPSDTVKVIASNEIRLGRADSSSSSSSWWSRSGGGVSESLLTSYNGRLESSSSSSSRSRDRYHSESPIIERDALEFTTMGGTLTHEAQNTLTLNFLQEVAFHQQSSTNTNTSWNYDLAFHAEDIQILNPYGESFVEGSEFSVKSGRDLTLQGGSVELFGDRSDYGLSDWSLKANQERSSLIEFRSESSADWSLSGNWNLFTQATILDGGSSSTSDETGSSEGSSPSSPSVVEALSSVVEVLSFHEVELSSGAFGEVLIDVGTLRASVEGQGNVLYQSGFESEILQSNRVALHSKKGTSGSPGGVLLHSGASLLCESNSAMLSSATSNVVLSAGTNVQIRTHDSTTDHSSPSGAIWMKSQDQTLVEAEEVLYHARRAEFSGSQVRFLSGKQTRIHSGASSNGLLEFQSGASTNINAQDALSLVGKSLSLESAGSLFVGSRSEDQSGPEDQGASLKQGDVQFHVGTRLHTTTEGQLSILATDSLKWILPSQWIHIINSSGSSSDDQNQDEDEDQEDPTTSGDSGTTGDSVWIAGEELSSRSGGDTRIFSERGPVGFYSLVPQEGEPSSAPDGDSDSDGEGKISFEFGGNLALAAGSRPGDVLSMSGKTLRFLSDRLQVSVPGALRFDLEGPVEVNAREGVVFEIGEEFLMESSDLVTQIGQSGMTLRGGNVDFASTVAELRFLAGKLIALNSTDVSVASKELDRALDGLFFSSNLKHMTLDSQSSVVLFSRDSLNIETIDTSPEVDDGEGEGGDEEGEESDGEESDGEESDGEESDGEESDGEESDSSSGNGSGDILIVGPSFVEIASGKTNPEYENQPLRVTTVGPGTGPSFKSGGDGEFLFHRGMVIHASPSSSSGGGSGDDGPPPPPSSSESSSSVRFRQSDLSLSAEEWIRFSSDGAFLIDHVGVDLDLVTSSGVGVGVGVGGGGGSSFAAHSQDLSEFRAGNTVSFVSQGRLRHLHYHQQEREKPHHHLDRHLNQHQHHHSHGHGYGGAVGLSVRTYDPSSDIQFLSSAGELRIQGQSEPAQGASSVVISAGKTFSSQSQELFSLDASKDLSVTSHSDTVTFKSPEGTIQLDVEDQLMIDVSTVPHEHHQGSSSEPAESHYPRVDLASQGRASLQSGSDWAVRSDSPSSGGRISLQTGGQQGQGDGKETGKLSIETKGDILVQGEDVLEVGVKRDLALVANQGWFSRGERGVSILSEGPSPVTFLAKRSTTITNFQSSSPSLPSWTEPSGLGSGNIRLISGGDFSLQDESPLSSEMDSAVFRGETVSWTATLGNVLMTAKRASLEAVGSVLIGTDLSPVSEESENENENESRVRFESGKGMSIVDEDGSGIFLDAGESIWFGKDVSESPTKVVFQGLGLKDVDTDMARSPGVEFLSQGDFSWTTDGPISVLANQWIDIQSMMGSGSGSDGSGSGSILFEGKDLISVRAMKDVMIRSFSGQVVVQSSSSGDGTSASGSGVVLEGRQSVRDHSDGLNSYEASSMNWFSPERVWSVEAREIREVVQGDYSVSCTDVIVDGDGKEAIGGRIQGGRLDYTFGKGLSLGDGDSDSDGNDSDTSNSGSGSGDIRLSSDGTLGFTIQGETEFKVLTDARILLEEQSPGGRTVLEFAPKNAAMDFQAGGRLAFQGGLGVSYSVSSFDGKLELQSERDLVLSVTPGFPAGGNSPGKIEVLSLGNLLVEAESAEVSPGELWSVISRGSSVVETSGELSVSSTRGLGVVTRPQSQGSIEIKSDSFTLDHQEPASDPVTSSGGFAGVSVSFNAPEGQFRCEEAKEIQIEASEARFVSEGKSAQIVIQVEESLSISTESVFASSGGTSVKSDSLLSAGDSRWSSLQDGLFSLWTSPSASQERSPIVFVAEDASLSAEEEISLTALSGLNPGELHDSQAGIVSIVSSDVEGQFGKYVRFVAEKGPIRVESLGEVLFSSEEAVLLNVHQEKGGIRVEAGLVDLTKVSQELEVKAGRKATISTESGVLELEVGDLISMKGVGPGGSVLVKTVREASEMEIRSKSLEWDSDLLSLKVRGDFQSKSATTTRFETTHGALGSKIEVVAQGIDPGGVHTNSLGTTEDFEHLFHLGMQLDSSRVESSSKALEMTASGGIESQFGSLKVTVKSFLIESRGNVEIEVKDVRAEDISIEAFSKGIEVSAKTGESLDLQSDGKFQITGGMWGGSSTIKLLSTNNGESEETGNIFQTEQSLVLSAESNIRFSSKEKISGVSETLLNFEAVKGDILFRSITVDQIAGSNGVEGPFDLLVEAREREGLVSFAPMQRMGHRQVSY